MPVYICKQCKKVHRSEEDCSNQTNRPPKEQKSASDSPELKFSKSKQTGTEIMTAKEFRKKYANKESGPGGLQEQVDNYLRSKNITSIRLPDAALNHLAKCWQVPENTRMGILKSIAGQPDNTVLLPIPNTKFNLAICLENKSKKGVVRKNQKEYAKKVNVNICRSKEQVKELIKEAEQFLKEIQED